MFEDVSSAMAQAGVPLLVLKGAALAQLVYEDPRLRPMRDVDLLVRKTDARRALDVLMRCGFPAGRPGRSRTPSPLAGDGEDAACDGRAVLQRRDRLAPAAVRAVFIEIGSRRVHLAAVRRIPTASG
jgi:Uncharacterised nucleotidyltransferase